ncbi:acyl-CoA dehydrogenase [Nocardia nova SH22a]|uniref:Acyl-CoA dehydrogenase n=1 Tax=Nocardia nova SH22a TaxID=1415166 RepID=W5TMD3_9NOCA|nr:acyl-CoA dehydrogenase family protein [Nocardia nova]AHH18371.1 acyl-CoA dehydrogenase [Nocardia nova SH22a]
MTASITATAAESAGSIAEELREVAERLPGMPFRDAWKVLLSTRPVAAVMDASLRERRGGAVRNAVSVIEGVGLAGVPSGLCYALTSQVFGIQWPLSELASRPLLPFADGIRDGSLILCHALTEDGGGSDPLSMVTAVEDGADGARLLTGRKAYVTAAPCADVVLTFARTEPGRHPFALSALLIPADRAGVSRSEPFDKLAVPEVPMGAVEFSGVRIDSADIVAAEGSGLALLSTTTTWERALLMSYAVGIMQRTLDRAVTWARTRRQFGRALGASPLVAARVADMAIAVHRVRTAVHSMAAQIDTPSAVVSSLVTPAALVKISCAQDLLDFETTAGQLFGARSVIADSGHTSGTTSALAASIYAGANDLLRVGIARDLGLPVEN